MADFERDMSEALGIPDESPYNPSRLMDLVRPSHELAAIVGAGTTVRTEITKKLWRYIKQHGLQDMKNRRMINADQRLRPLFSGEDQVSMFQLTRIINKNLRKPE